MLFGMGCHGLTSESPQRMKGSTNVRISEWLPIRHSLTPSFVGIRSLETEKYQSERCRSNLPASITGRNHGRGRSTREPTSRLLARSFLGGTPFGRRPGYPGRDRGIWAFEEFDRGIDDVSSTSDWADDSVPRPVLDAAEGHWPAGRSVVLTAIKGLIDSGKWT